jgi:hypothetical protein
VAQKDKTANEKPIQSMTRLKKVRIMKVKFSNSLTAFYFIVGAQLSSRALLGLELI